MPTFIPSRRLPKPVAPISSDGFAYGVIALMCMLIAIASIQRPSDAEMALQHMDIASP